ncbi:MAG: hypothetical protein ACYSYT_00715 [Planctomycetota bacterium]
MKSKRAKPVNGWCALCGIVMACFLTGIQGCETGGGKESAAEQIRTLREEKTELLRQIEEAAAKNEQLKGQIEVLAGLPAEVRAEDLYEVQQVKITRYTNLYDRDDDGKYEKLIVYIQPIDAEGDIVKATGAVDVQLDDWEGRKLGRWHVGADELKELWFATILIINYRLTFDLPETIDDFEDPLTVKVAFTDYLTGKVFKEQKEIKP